jgi:integrase
LTTVEGKLATNHAQNQKEDTSLSSTASETVSDAAGERIYLVTDGLRSKHTKTNYRLTFNQFLKDGAHTTDLQVLLDYKPRILESMVIGYIEGLRDKGRAHKTIQLHCAAIFHFFEMNDVSLIKRKIMRFVPPDESDATNTDKAYTVEEIRRILDQGCTDTRTKAIVLLMVSAGMRIGALPGLRFEHLTYIAEYSLYKILVYASSKPDRYFTFRTPECATAVQAYLDYRRRAGEKITDKSPLIREMFNMENPFIINTPRPSTERMMALALEQSLARSGVNQRTPSRVKKSRREIMRSHGFRKFYITQCDRANVRFTVREYLSGHRLPNQDPRYIRTEEEDRLLEYLKAIPFLTIDPKHRLQKQIKDLQDKHSQEWGALKEEMSELKRLLHGVGGLSSKKEELQRRMINRMQGDISDELQREYWESEAKEDNRSGSSRSP